MHVTSPDFSSLQQPDPLTPDDAAALRLLAGSHWGPDSTLTLPSGRRLTSSEAQALTSAYAPAAPAIMPVSPAPGFGPPFSPQPWPYQGPPAVANPSVKRTNRRNWIILGAVGLAALGVLIVTVAMAATPSRQAAGGSTYKPIYDNNGAAPVTPATIGPTYANPTDADFKLVPKVTQKQCFGSAGCNVTFTVNLSYVGKGAKPNSTWDITFDAVGTEDALTDTITVHVDGTGLPGTYDSREQIVQTKKSSDAITLRITAIAPGNG